MSLSGNMVGDCYMYYELFVDMYAHAQKAERQFR